MDATSPRHGRPAWLPLVVCLLAAAALTGCRWWPSRRQAEIPVYSELLTKEDLVRSLNANIEPLAAWRCTNAKIKARGMMPLVELSAHVAVARPRNFRLLGKLLKPVADLGSNDERFWFWFDGHPQKRTFTARHADTDYAQRLLQIPFEPDWLLEALGVIPLDADEFAMQPDEGTGTISLVAERMTSSGRIFRRLILVDARYRLIVTHALFDTSGHLVARAALSDHRSDQQTGLVLPHRIDLEWPQAELAMTMTLGQVEVNPNNMSEQTWAMPSIPGYPVYEIAGPATHRGPAGRTPLPFHAGPAEQLGEASVHDGTAWSEAGFNAPASFDRPERFDTPGAFGPPVPYVPPGEFEPSASPYER